MRTFIKKKETVKYNWYIVDAEKKILGRLATILAYRLRGKHKIEYSPHIDVGDYIVVINAAKIIVSGNKYNDKKYYKYTGYSGGIKEKTFSYMINHFPTKVIESAVKGMLPNGPLGRAMLRKLKVYADSNHIHIAQQPKILNI